MSNLELIAAGGGAVLRFALVAAAIVLIGAGLLFLRANKRSRIVLSWVIAAAAASFVALVVALLNPFSLYDGLLGFADRLGSSVGLSTPAIQAIALLSLIPVMTLISWSIAFSSRKRWWGLTGLVGLLAAYFGALAVTTSSNRVAASGEALQCYVITPTGVVWRDIRYAGTDPQSGRDCLPAKPYLLPILDRLDELVRRGGQLTPTDPNGEFFSPIGEPIVWFSRRAAGELTFFSSPGTDPMTGLPLHPVTLTEVQEWQEQKERLARAAEQEAMAQEARRAADAERERIATEEAQRAAERADAERAQAAEEARIAEMRRLVLATRGERALSAVGIVIEPTEPKSELDVLAAGLLPTGLAAIVPAGRSAVLPLFSQQFVTDGFFAATMNGDLRSIAETGALDVVGGIILGRVSIACEKSSVDDGLSSCHGTLQYRIVGEGPAVLDDGQISAVGLGVTESLATERAVELLVERSGDAVFAKMEVRE